jgi:hypothetical protein
LEFEDYYKSLGLTSYPFSVYTAEAEREKAEIIYKKPSNYSVIHETLNGSSVIVTGERGSGKTALNLDIVRRKMSDNKLLVHIEDFSNLEEEFNHEQLYRFITERIAGEFFKKMELRPNSFWKYDKDDRLNLSMYLHQFVPASTKKQLRDHIKIIQQGIVQRYAIILYNITRVILNYGLKAATKVVSDALTRHFSALPEFDAGDAEYFKKLEIELDESFTPEDRSWHYMEKLCSLILKSNIDEIIIVIDKIDEDPRFKNDAERIAIFIERLASNHKLIINCNFKVVLFVWSTPFNSIKSSIRTQKISLQTLSWTGQELKEVAGKRLYAFSEKSLNNIESIFDNDALSYIDDMIYMCNENPRDLWHILNKSLVSQFEIDCSKKITKEAIEKGIEKFVREFNYYEYYPKKTNARKDSMDIYSYIKHLLKLNSDTFTKNQLNELAGTGSSTSNYVVAMENMGLIRRTGDKKSQGGLVYNIRDPKVRYARDKGIDVSQV